MRNWWSWLALSAVVIVLDQLTKQWVTQSLGLREVIPVMPSFNLVLAHNAGAAFSFLAGAGDGSAGFSSALR